MKEQTIQISLFYCANSLQANDLDLLSNKINSIKIRAISLPCSGKVNLLYLLKAVETDSDGLLLVTCKLGECKYLQGNFRAQKRAEYVDDLLFETGYGRSHIKFVSLENENKIDSILSAINALAETLRVELPEAQKTKLNY